MRTDTLIMIGFFTFSEHLVLLPTEFTFTPRARQDLATPVK